MGRRLSIPRLALAALALPSSVAFVGCNRSVTPAECTAMMDRYVDMTLAGDPTLAGLSPAQQDVARDMKKALKKAEKSYRQVQDQCEHEVHRNEFNCAMAAKTPGDWEACID